MLTVRSLSRHEIRARLAGAGLDVRTGCFMNRIHSPIARVADSIALLYGDYPLGEPDGFADFHVTLHASGGVRRWYRPQVSFDVDGQVPFEPLPQAQAFPMLEWGLNWCIATRVHAYLTVHAAVIERNGLAAILPAPPGSGKSTLCAALVSRGWRLLSDEMAMFRLDNDMLVPAPRPISLKNRSIDVIRAFGRDPVLSDPIANTAKGTVAHMKAPAESIARAHETARPAWIVFPKYEAGIPTTLAPIPRARAFMRVADNAFNYSVLGAAGFRTLGNVIERCASFDFRYSNLDEAIEVFAALEPPRP